MKKLIALLAVSTAISLPAVALAQSSSMSGAPSMTSAQMMATMECRPAAKGEKPNATMSAGDAPLVCKKIDMSAMHDEMMKMPTGDQQKMTQNLEIHWNGGIVSGQ